MMTAPSRWTEIRAEAGRAIAALLIALIVAFVIVLSTSSEPAEAFKTLLTAPLSSSRTRGYWIDDVAKLTLFLTDLAHFPKVNEIMQSRFAQPFPARSTVGVSSLPRGAQFEVEAVMVLP